MYQLIIVLIGLINATNARGEESFLFELHPKEDSVNVVITGFSSEDEEKIENGLEYLGYQIREYYNDKDRGLSPTRYERCVGQFAKKDFYRTDVGIDVNAFWTMSDLRMMVANHAKYGKPFVILSYYNATQTNTGQANIGRRPSSPENVPSMDIGLNKNALSYFGDEREVWASTIFHELLHRTGLVHDNGYEGSLIKEADLCVKHGFSRNARSGGFNQLDYLILN